MADPAHEQTEELIEEIRRRVSREYLRAYEEAEAKLADYLRRFEAKDRIHAEAVRSGEETEADYREWRRGQILVGKRWQELVDTLAEDYRNADRIAASIVNGYTPEAYALNHDYATFQVEKGSRVDTSYTLYSRATVERLLRDRPDLLPRAKVDGRKDLRWNRRHIASAVTQGVLQGEDLGRVSKRIRPVADMDERAAMRTARTAMTSAQNAGRLDAYRRAAAMGIDVRKKWRATLDRRTRHSHRRLDDEVAGLDEAFSNGLMYPGDPSGTGSEVYNCFLGDVSVDSDSEIVRSYESLYVGETITVDTAAGVHFTCTPNHPILTDKGWVPASLLNEGHNLLVTFRTGARPGPDPDVQHGFASFKTVHKLLREFGCERASGLRVNFHGDRPASDVEVVGKEGLLRVCGDVTGIENVDELLLELTDPSASAVGSVCELPGGCTALRPSDMGGFRDALLLVLGHRGHADVHRLGSVPRSDAAVAEDAIDNLPAETVCRRELLGGLSGKVTIDKVISVKVGSTGGSHVYNLQTGDGYYFVSSIIPGMDNGIFAIAKNCRCTMVPDLPDYPAERVERASRLGSMSYGEWRGERPAADGLLASVPAVPLTALEFSRGLAEMSVPDLERVGEKQVGALSPEARRSLEAYTNGPDYLDINGALRDGSYGAGTAGSAVSEYVGGIDEAMAGSRSDMELYLTRRVAGTDAIEGILAEVGRDAAKRDPSLLVGRVMVDRGFVSTSASATAIDPELFGMDLEIYAHAPEGARGVYVAGLSEEPEQMEFLLDRGTQFVITDANYVVTDEEWGEGTWQLWVEVVQGR